MPAREKLNAHELVAGMEALEAIEAEVAAATATTRKAKKAGSAFTTHLKKVRKELMDSAG